MQAVAEICHSGCRFNGIPNRILMLAYEVAQKSQYLLMLSRKYTKKSLA